MKILTICLSAANLSTFYEHKHDAWELTLNISGNGLNYYDHKPEKFGPGTILICPPGVVHCKRTSFGYYQDLYVVFDGSYLVDNLKHHTYQDDPSHTVETLLRLIMNIHYKQEKDSAAITAHLLETVLRILATKESILTDERQKISAVQTEIIQNFSNPEYKLQETLARCSYSDDYIRRCFRAQYGVTPLEYLNRLRINHAKTLLQMYAAENAISISNIALQSGFYDASYFSRVFKKLESITPHAYRKRKSKEGQPHMI